MKNQKGITLIALIITIIVMLILVAVSVAVVINSNLLTTAENAGNNTEKAYEDEKDQNFGYVINYNGENKTIEEIASEN